MIITEEREREKEPRSKAEDKESRWIERKMVGRRIYNWTMRICVCYKNERKSLNKDTLVNFRNRTVIQPHVVATTVSTEPSPNWHRYS